MERHEVVYLDGVVIDLEMFEKALSWMNDKYETIPSLIDSYDDNLINNFPMWANANLLIIEAMEAKLD